MARTGEYAPPSALPVETVTIFTDGGADYDPKAKAWVAAGDGEEGGPRAFVRSLSRSAVQSTPARRGERT